MHARAPTLPSVWYMQFYCAAVCRESCEKVYIISLHFYEKYSKKDKKIDTKQVRNIFFKSWPLLEQLMKI